VSDLDVRMFTVGPVQENAYIVTADPRSADSVKQSPGGAGGRGRSAVMVDPGEEPERLLAAARALEVEVEAILITHCHFDHIGAVAPVARATGAPVYCPEIERPLLADIMRWVPTGFGPFESWEPEHTVSGGERLSLAGLEVEVLFTPGHSPGHVTYAIAPASTDADRALLSGDVLFQGSVGRVDLPGGDWGVLERSIGALMRAFAPQTVVYPGHMGVTTLGRELQTNPFLAELRASEAPAPERRASEVPVSDLRAPEAPVAGAPTDRRSASTAGR
jgi:hydroxyacylglutathione hydrolase